MSIVPSREEALFSDALAQPPAERGTFLAKACGADINLLARLIALVAAHEGTSSVLAGTPAADAIAALHEEQSGDVIGHYKLLQKLGEGGCGVVWMAEQEEPVRRRVALKVIKLGMDTKAVVARFEAERQALAMMDHPNIAKVHDAGATDTGRPFFVLELVRGIPITKYCDENHLTPTARLELFIKVCQAVQHAHQKGIIHRDLKPSNILVTVNDGAPTPKVIDFGIAKATQGKLTDATVFTAFEQFIGTPVYMSPEQAEMSSLDIDTRSDIYSLGVLLYELLTGRPPFDPKAFAQASVDQVRKQIREVEPPRPSARLSTLDEDERTTIARLRGTAPSNLSIILRGDLDWIVMRCIEKDRTRRYDTANGLAMDIQRYLRNEPVVARPPSTAYLVQKLIRRHRVGFAATATVAAVVVAGAVFSAWQAVRARRAERQAVIARQNEALLRRKAEAEERTARLRAYAGDMNLAQQAVAMDNVAHARELLVRHVPAPGAEDFRGWEWRYLWHASRGDRHRVLEQGTAAVSSLACSPDGRWLAAGNSAGRVSIWDLRLQRKFELQVGNGKVTVAFSPCTPFVAVSGTGGGSREGSSTELWDLTSRHLVRRFETDARCAGLAFSEDGRTLLTATARSRPTVTKWQVHDGHILASYAAPGSSGLLSDTGRFAVSPDLRLAAYPTENVEEFRVIDLATGQERWRAKGIGNSLPGGLAFSPDGKLLASGTGYAVALIRLWDAATGADIGQLEGHRSWVTSLVFSPDGTTLMSASSDRTVRVWDVPSRQLRRTFRGQRAVIEHLIRHHDPALFVTGARDGAVCVWDTTASMAGGGVHVLPERVEAWRFSADSRSLFTWHEDTTLFEWSVPGFQPKRKIEYAGVRTAVERDGLLAAQFSVVFAREQPLIAFGSSTGIVQVWDFEQRSKVAELNIAGGRVIPVAFIGRGDRLVAHQSGAGTNAYQEWDLRSRTRAATWPSPADSNAWSFAISPDETQAVVIGVAGHGTIRHLATGKTANLKLAAEITGRPQLSAEARFLATIDRSETRARVWKLPGGEEIASVSGFFLKACSVAFVPDATRLVTGSHGAEAVRIWDIESRLPLLTLDGRVGNYHHLAFSPDGTMLVAQSGPRLLHIWRAPTFEEIAAFERAEAGK